MKARCRFAVAGLLVTALCAGTSGCFWVTTKHEGKTLRKDVDALDTRLTKKEDTLDAKVKKLEAILQEATKLLKRNSADLGADVQALTEETAKMTGLVMEAYRAAEDVRKEIASMKQGYETRIADLEARMVVVEQTVKHGIQPATPGELFAAAKADMDAGNFASARTRFKDFITKYPSDDLAPEAQYMRADAFYREQNYKGALAEFQKVFDAYPKSKWADDALFRAAESAEQLKWCTDARAYLSLLRQKYPSSSLKKSATSKDRELKNNQKNKKKCQS